MSSNEKRIKTIDNYIIDRNSSASVDKMISYFSSAGYLKGPNNKTYGNGQANTFADYYNKDFPPSSISPSVSAKKIDSNGAISLDLTLVGFGYHVVFEFESDTDKFKLITITNKSWFS